MITQQEIDTIIDTFKPYHPTKIGIFGSYACGDNHEKSDIDILYAFDSRYSLFDLVDLQLKLRDKLNKQVDLVEFTVIHPKLKEQSLNVAKIIYEA